MMRLYAGWRHQASKRFSLGVVLTVNGGYFGYFTADGKFLLIVVDRHLKVDHNCFSNFSA